MTKIIHVYYINEDVPLGFDTQQEYLYRGRNLEIAKEIFSKAPKGTILEIFEGRKRIHREVQEEFRV